MERIDAIRRFIKYYVKWTVIMIGLGFIFCPYKDPLIDERIFGVLLVWMAIDITRKCR